jgi:hypothetical protein
MKRAIPTAMSFRVCVYPDCDDPTMFIAHSLEVDVIGTGSSVQDALSELLEVIEVQLDSCDRTGAHVFFPAPNDVWELYRSKDVRKLSGELADRIIRDANKRLGHNVPSFDNIHASQDIPSEQFVMA